MEIKDEAIQQIQTIYDPEIPVNIYELGLIYEVNVDIDNNVQVLMTLTAPSNARSRVWMSRSTAALPACSIFALTRRRSSCFRC